MISGNLFALKQEETQLLSKELCIESLARGAVTSCSDSGRSRQEMGEGPVSTFACQLNGIEDSCHIWRKLLDLPELVGILPVTVVVSKFNSCGFLGFGSRPPPFRTGKW